MQGPPGPPGPPGETEIPPEFINRLRKRRSLRENRNEPKIQDPIAEEPKVRVKRNVEAPPPIPFPREAGRASTGNRLVSFKK